jgi:hypothetical protein
MRKITIVIICIILITTFSCIFPIKMTVADPPYVPNTPNPADNSTNVELDTNLSWSGGDPDVGDTVTYDVYLDKTNPPILVAHNISITKYVPALTYNISYYWKIVAWDSNSSSQSPIWTFTTELQPNRPPIIPSEPNPSNGSLAISINADLSWNCSDPDNDLLTYDVYFGESSLPPLEESGVSDSTYPLGTMSYGTTYYWKIVAKDIHNETQSGPIWHFQTNQLPFQPDNPIPSNESTNISINAHLNWTCDDPDPGDTVTYDVYFGTSNSPSIVSDNQTGLGYNPGILAYNTLYYWKIIAWDEQDASTAGSLWSFITGTQVNQPPNVPSNPTPSDGFLGALINASLNWTGGDPDGDSVLYDVYFGTSSSPPKVSSNQSETSYDPGQMEYVTIYYWRIVAWDSHNVSSLGSIWDFTTKSETNHPPNVPNSLIPLNGSINVLVNADISWLGGDPDPGDTVTYDVYFGTSSPPQKRVSNMTGTSYDPGTMGYSTTYYWKIIAWDSLDNSSASPLFHFKTAIQTGGGGEEPPQPPQNIKPIADPGGPYQGYINSMILFNGSECHDPDGNIISWLWDFGDNSTANGMIVNHSFVEAGTYIVTLNVTDNRSATNTDTTNCVIRELNRPPTKPTIQGNISGTKNTLYTYTVVSTDPDNDPLQYTYEWGGSISQLSGFIPSGMNYSVNHNWTTAGRYNLTVTVTDKQLESSSKIAIYIDAIQTRGAGYLFDNDGDGIYDAFYSDETHKTVLIQTKGDSYLIDKDGDGQWEYVYNTTYGLTSYQEPRKTPGFELIFVLSGIALAIVILRKKQII